MISIILIYPSCSTCCSTISIVINVPVRPTPALERKEGDNVGRKKEEETIVIQSTFCVNLPAMDKHWSSLWMVPSPDTFMEGKD